MTSLEARLLKAAKRFGIVPVGFITGQLQSERELGRRGEPVHLPAGFVTMLFTDVEGSTGLLHRLGDGYGELLDGVRVILEGTATEHAGHIVETRADEVFAVFEQPAAAVESAAAMQRTLAAASWPGEVDVRVRIGIHSGTSAARCAELRRDGGEHRLADLRCRPRRSDPRFRRHSNGDARFDSHRVPTTQASDRCRCVALPEEVALYQVLAKGLLRSFPPPRTR